MNQPWNIQLFGALRVSQQERTISRFRTQKTGALLAYLAYHQQHSHPREVLIELFWPETNLESGRHNLSHALSSLRSLLEPPGVPAGTVLIADRFTVELNPEAINTDVEELENALQKNRSGCPRRGTGRAKGATPTVLRTGETRWVRPEDAWPQAISPAGSSARARGSSAWAINRR